MPPKAREMMEAQSKLSLSERLEADCDMYNKQPGDLQGYDCHDCLNRGYKYAVRENEIIQRRCRCIPIRNSYLRIENSGLKNLMEEYTFDNYQASEAWQKAVKDKALSYIANPSDRWFYVGGQVGSGKTHICTALTGELLKGGKSAKYMLWRDEAVSLKSNVMDEGYEAKLKPYKTVSVLYIDDFLKIARGASAAPTQGDLNLAFEIINSRYNNRELITVISSEHSIDALLTFDEAVGSRIYDRSKGYCTNIPQTPAANYRLRGRK